MDYTKFKNVISKFSKKEIVSLFEPALYKSMNEWVETEETYSQTSLINILVSIDGYLLFKKKEFRKSFFEALEYSELKKILPNDKSLPYEELAQKAASIQFADNEMYSNLFSKVLNCADFKFDEYVKEASNENISSPEEKFFELLDYQYIIEQQTVYELKKKNKIGRKILIHMPTGTGKTKTTMHIISNYLNFVNPNNGKVMWIADRNELLTQAADTFKNVWSHLGRTEIDIYKGWGQGNKTKDARICFVSIQTLVKMRKEKKEQFSKFISDISLIVFDECHKIGAPEYRYVVQDITQSTEELKRDFIGLTATPGRTTQKSSDNTRFTDYFDRIIDIDCNLVENVNKSKIEAANSKKYAEDQIIAYFQERKILSKIEKEELTYKIDKELLNAIEKEYRSSKEEYSDKIISKIAENRSRNSVIINKLKELNTQKIPTIVFACSLNHAKLLSAFLNIENIPNSLVFGSMTEAARKKAISDFKDRENETNIIINYDILTTGFDATNIDCVFITRPTKSIILYSQMIGRGLRGPMMGGNEKCKLIDVKDNLSIYDENEAFSHFKYYWR